MPLLLLSLWKLSKKLHIAKTCERVKVFNGQMHCNESMQARRLTHQSAGCFFRASYCITRANTNSYIFFPICLSALPWQCWLDKVFHDPWMGNAESTVLKSVGGASHVHLALWGENASVDMVWMCKTPIGNSFRIWHISLFRCDLWCSVVFCQCWTEVHKIISVCTCNNLFLFSISVERNLSTAPASFPLGAFNDVVQVYLY